MDVIKRSRRTFIEKEQVRFGQEQRYFDERQSHITFVERHGRKLNRCADTETKSWGTSKLSAADTIQTPDRLPREHPEICCDEVDEVLTAHRRLQHRVETDARKRHEHLDRKEARRNRPSQNANSHRHLISSEIGRQTDDLLPSGQLKCVEHSESVIGALENGPVMWQMD
jgi:hypothetical protein